jgi:hypothetical protein
LGTLKHTLPLLLLWLTVTAQAQVGLSGQVLDSLTGEPLAFVSVVYNEGGQGVVTNLDGFFRIPASARVTFLKFRYVGYRDKSMPATGALNRKEMVVTLVPQPYDIGEVRVYPTENPAHRIIRLASENRNRNNPEKTGPFSYISYDKLVFDLQPDTAHTAAAPDSLPPLPVTLPDTLKYGLDQKGRVDVKRFLDKQYLFMMETVSSRKFESPGKNHEEVIASKVSGISQPSFVIMARQFQSFSFYENFITIANRQFLNPIATGSTEKYFFLIQDTLYTDRRDTVFIISFRPYKGRNFDGMKGVLYINSNGYAVQNVIAEASEQKEDPFKVSIQQQYDFVNGERWFPVQLNSTILFNFLQPGQPFGKMQIVGTGKSYLVNINFNPVFSPGEFSDVAVDVRPDAHRQTSETWNAYRVDSLTARESETYRFIDSIGKAEHLDRTVASFETLMTGSVPGRYFSFDLRRFVGYNSYEGFRFGAGGQTTPEVSKRVILGGYLAYSLRDAAWKYGGNLTLNLIPKHETGLTFSYRSDVNESGGIRFHEPWNISGSAFIRDYMIEVMDVTREAGVTLGWRALKYLSGQLYATKGSYDPTDSYGYSLGEHNPEMILTAFRMSEAGLRLRYAYGETFFKTPRGNRFSLGTRFPVVCLNLARGGTAWNGEFRYWRTEMKLTKAFKTKSFGESRVAIIGGLVTGEAPYSRLYAPLASYKPFTVESEQSFGTMRLNEFVSDRFVGFFFKQDFGKLLFKPRGKFQPEIALVHNLGFGTLKAASAHRNIALRTFSKGYFEGGLLINNLFRIQLFRYGVGVMYRYGPYAYPKTIDNFAFKLTLQLSM